MFKEHYSQQWIQNTTEDSPVMDKSYITDLDVWKREDFLKDS